MTARWRHQEHTPQALLTLHGNNDRVVSHPESDSRLKMEHIIPHLMSVNEIYTPLAEQILADHQKGDTTSIEGVVLLLNTRMTTLLQDQPVLTT